MSSVPVPSSATQVHVIGEVRGAKGGSNSVAVMLVAAFSRPGSKGNGARVRASAMRGKHKSVPFEFGNDMSQALKPELDAPAQARRSVASALDAWGLDPISDDAILLTSELVTNAVIHAGTPIVLVVQHIQRGVRIEVNDDAPSLPERRYADGGPPRRDGRGVWLLDQLADRWGVQRRPTDSKVVWFELDER
jgi:anti-sigma regulatory factor (Ser/Thr protein kinase)